MLKFYRLNLQFFAEDDVIRGGYVPEETEPIENPLLSDDPVDEPDTLQPETPEGMPEGAPEGMAEGNPEETPEENNLFDFGGRKVDPNDPDSLKGLHEDWTQTQRYIQQMQAERQQMQQQMYQMAQMQQQLFQQQQQPQAQPEPQEDVEKINEQLMERFYENPKGLFDEIKQQAIEEAKKLYEPIVKERQYQSEIQNVASKYQDFQQYVEPMAEIVERLGEEEANRIGLENIYFMAKGRVGQQQPDPMQFLNDPNFVKQHVMSNEQIRNEIYNELMKNKQQSQPKAPVMGNQYGGQPSFVGQNRPKSVEEATRLARQYFNQN